MKDAVSPKRGEEFTPLLGKRWLTHYYDCVIGLFTRETKWRRELVDQAQLVAGDRVIDVGCGTGTLLAALMSTCPGAKLVAVDPDPAALALARRKLGNSKDLVHWHNGFLGSLVLADNWRPNKIACSLVLHQVAMPEKRAILEAIESLLSADGVALFADYMRQDRPLMRACFRATVQLLDGVDNTQPSADGAVEALLEEIFSAATRITQIHTATGTISLWRGFKKGDL